MVKLAFWKDWSGCFCGEDGLQEAIIEAGRDMSGHCAVIQVSPLCNGTLDLAGSGR